MKRSEGETFVNALFGACHGANVEVRCLPSGKQIFVGLEQFAMPNLPQGENIYVGVASRNGGGSREHVVEVPALWADLDFKTLPEPEAQKRIEGFPLRPSIVVESGGGLHVYWLLKEPAGRDEIEAIESLNRRLAAGLGSDPNVCDAARILRLPGTANFKYRPPRPVKILSVNRDNQYLLSDFDEFLPEDPGARTDKGTGATYNPGERIEAVMAGCAFLRHCRDEAATLPEPEWYCMVSQFARMTKGPAWIHKLSRPHPKYAQKETDAKILRAINSASGPHSCEYIKRLWNCGRDCGVKAPAKLAYGDKAPTVSDGEFIDKCAREGELGDARLFVALARDRFAYDHAAARWFRFLGNHWGEDVLGEVFQGLQEVGRAYAGQAEKWGTARLSAAKEKNKELEKLAAERVDLLVRKIGALQRVRHVRDVLTFAAAGADSLGITGDEWDCDPWTLGVTNGVLNLRTGEFRPGRPADYIRKVSPVEWRGIDTPCPHWGEFLREIFQEQTEKVDYLQRLLGYALTGLTVEHVLPIFWGEGRNGKGTLIETVNHVLGPLAGPIEAEMLLQQAHPKASGGPTSDVMALRGRRLAWASETDEGRRFNAGKVKWYVGGDSLTGRDPYGRRQVTFVPSHLLILLTNRKPHAPADDFAFWARIHLLEFGLQFVDEPAGPKQRKRDPAIGEKLRAESAGIIAWLIRGCLEWQRQGGLNPPASVKAATESYRASEDIIGAFLADSCTEGPLLTVKAGTLYQKYREWCQENGHRTTSNSRFKERVAARFPWTRDRGGAVYSGIGLQEV